MYPWRMVTIYTVAFNESFFLPYMVEHYRKMFPKCRIVVADNQSTDDTVDKAKELGCEVEEFDTGGTYKESAQMQIKNHAWKRAETDWVIVCDVDELGYIDEKALRVEASMGTSVVRFNGYEMVGMSEEISVPSMSRGVPSRGYSKSILFDRTKIREIDYLPGAHVARPKGDVVHSKTAYTLGHYKWLSTQYVVDRYRMVGARIHPENVRNGWGTHYLRPERAIIADIARLRASSVEVPLPSE